MSFPINSMGGNVYNLFEDEEPPKPLTKEEYFDKLPSFEKYKEDLLKADHKLGLR